MKKRVLCLLEDGFEETEMVTPVNMMRRGGVDVVTASWDGAERTGKAGMRMIPDASFGSLDPNGFDALFLPGGPAVMALRRDGRAAQLAADFHRTGRLVAAICAAPLILKDAGLLAGRKFTAHDSVHGELPGVCGDRVVVDGLVVTSRAAGTALDLGLELVRLLAGPEAAATVSQAVMA